MQCDMIDRFTFASLLDNMAEWKCSCIDGVKFLKVLSLRVHRIRGSHGILALKLCTFCTICMFLIEAVCARRIEGED